MSVEPQFQEDADVTATGTIGQRWGKVPDDVANHQGLSFEATAIIARRTIWVGVWGTGYGGVAAAFRPSRSTGKTGMHHETFRGAIAEIGDKDLWRRGQRGRAYAKEVLLFAAEPSRYRRTEEAWLDGKTFDYREYALLTYVRANAKGVTPAHIDRRFRCSRPTTNKLCKRLMHAGWLRNAGSSAAPLYVCISRADTLSGTGDQTTSATGSQTLKGTGRIHSANPPRSAKTPQGAPRVHVPIGNEGLIEEEAAPATASLNVARSLIDKAHGMGLDVAELRARLAKRLVDPTQEPVDDIDAYFRKMVGNAIDDRGLRCTVERSHREARKVASAPVCSHYPSPRVVGTEETRRGAAAVKATMGVWQSRIEGRQFASQAAVDQYFRALVHARAVPPTPMRTLNGLADKTAEKTAPQITDAAPAATKGEAGRWTVEKLSRGGRFSRLRLDPGPGPRKPLPIRGLVPQGLRIFGVHKKGRAYATRSTPTVPPSKKAR